MPKRSGITVLSKTNVLFHRFIIAPECSKNQSSKFFTLSNYFLVCSLTSSCRASGAAGEGHEAGGGEEEGGAGGVPAGG